MNSSPVPSALTYASILLVPQYSDKQYRGMASSPVRTSLRKLNNPDDDEASFSLGMSGESKNTRVKNMLDSKCSKCIFAQRKEKNFFSCNFDWESKLNKLEKESKKHRLFPISHHLLVASAYRSRVQMFPIFYDPTLIREDCDGFKEKKVQPSSMIERPIGHKIISNIRFIRFHNFISLNFMRCR